MVFAAMRFNWILADFDAQRLSDMHKAALDMAAYGEQHGIGMVTLEEHHGADNGWSPSPLIMASALLARTKTLSVNLSALLVPLHDPLRIAEDIAVIDHLSGGRFSLIAGLGYRPEEYAAHGKSWEGRGDLFTECIDVMLKAWTGEPFEYRGTKVKVTPRPFTQPHPTLMLGGTSKASARRAAKFGLPYFPADHMPELQAYYYEMAKEYGTADRAFSMMPGEETVMLHVAEDPDKAWTELGPYLLNETVTYANWQTPDIRSAVHSHAKTWQELRKEGIYQILSPEQCVEKGKAAGAAAAFNLHPMCGGLPIDEAWKSVTLLAEQVLPKLA